MTPSQGGVGEKLEIFVRLVRCGQMLKKTDRILNLVRADNLCKMKEFSIIYR